ncbi:MAG: hypothetical protein QM482_03035 [Sulfurospirillum sp.]
MKKISILAGLVLLLAALALSYISANNGTKMLAKRDALVMKYVNLSDSALEDEDIKGAIKYAKLAIQADPKSKKGYVCYTNAMEEKYQSSGDSGNPNTPQTGSGDASMGC